VLLREGIVRLLQEADLDVVAQAASADELMRKVRAHKPDIAITDIRMPPGNADDGLQAAREIRNELPETSVLVLSQYVDEHYVVQLLSGGADGVGYLLKDRVSDVDSFLDAIKRVANGGSALDPEVVSRMVGRRDDDPLQELTPREREVLELMAQGLSNKGICEKLFLSERAVERHITGVLTKLGIPTTGQEHRRVLAVLAYLRS
jgi:DNA-binding NarL/FixJ family response regulator